MRARTTHPGTSAAPRRTGRLASAALLLSASFVASRLLGMLRNSVIAYSFGQGGATDAYFAAFNIPDTIFTLVSGAAMATAFVPAFAGLLEHGDEEGAWDVASTVLNSVLLTFAVVAAIAWLFAPPLMHLFVAGFRSPAEEDLTVQLTRIMLLQPIFLGTAAIVSSILQTYHRFTPTAVAPLVYNLAVIVGALVFRSHGISALAWSVVIGSVLYLLVQLPSGLEHSRYRPLIDWHSPGAREILRLLGPRVLGLASFRVMLLITLILAAGLPSGSLSAINYAWMLIQFPIGALGTAAATAIFPTLSRLTAGEDFVAVRRTLNRSMRLVIFLSVPAAVGLIVLRRPIVNVLYHHGPHFTGHNTEQTAFALLFYAMAVPPLAAIEILPRVFYAMRDTATPVRIAIVAVVVDAILSIVLVEMLPRASGQGGLALATVVASALQAVWLANSLENRLQGFGRAALLGTVRDTLIASLVMGLALYVFLDPVTWLFSQQGVGGVITVAVETAIGLGTFAAASYVLGTPELWQVRGFVRR